MRTSIIPARSGYGELDDEAWSTLQAAAVILEQYGYHDLSVAVFGIAERGE